MSNSNKIRKGSTVEVSSNDPGFDGSWYVATVIDQTKKHEYIIKYDTLLKDDGSNDPLTETVDPSCVRPLPPPNNNNIKNAEEFEVYDVVDAYHRDGWWIGVVNKVVNGGEGRGYVVGFENPHEEVEFGKGELRLHVDWVDGRWRVPPKKIPEDVLLARKAKRASQSDNDACSDLATPSKGAQTTDVDIPTVDPLLPSIKESLSKKNTESDSEMAGSAEASAPSKKNKRIMNSVEQDSSGKRFKSSAGSMGNTKAKVPVTEKCVSDANNHDSPIAEHQMITTEACKAEDDQSHRKKKRKRRSNLLEGGHEIAIGLDEQPLSQLPGLNRSTCRRPDRCDEPLNQATVTSVETTDYEKIWPFIKRSPIWATIASLEVYQTPPQRPHFSPLKEVREEYREGLAIAHMVTFGNLVQMFSEIRLTDPINIINNSLEILGDLETHGFNVGVIRERLNKLLSLKSKASQHEIELKKVEAELENRNGEKHVEEEEMKEMEMKMQELQEKLAHSETTMKAKEKKVMKLQSNLRNLSEQVTDCELAFKKLAATPLQVNK